MAIGLAWGCLLGAGIACAGIESFDSTGLSNDWVASGSFTGQQGIVWTFANARGIPMLSNTPSITLRSLSAADKGWLKSETITGGAVRVSALFKQDLSVKADCDIWVGDLKVGNYASGGTQGLVEAVSLDVVDPATRLPPTNGFTLMISNQLASSSSAVAIDDLSWDPFRLFVRLDRTGTNTAYAGQDWEFDVTAEVFDTNQVVTGGWEIQPAFAVTNSDTNSLHLTLIPAEADIGKTFTLTYTAMDSEGEGYTNQASCWMEVLEGPRFIDFERASFGYDTNSGVVTNLNGMNWTFTNVMTSDSTDRKIGTTSARFKHTTALPASMESQDSFAGIGTV